MMVDPLDLAAGARNLLLNCAKLKSGDRLLILREPEALGWYDEAAPLAVEAEARALGMNPSQIVVGGPGEQITRAVSDAVNASECCVFFARVGDQNRFSHSLPGKTVVMSYARNAAMMASSFGRADHAAFEALRDAVNDVLLQAGEIEITCPLGTKLVGSLTPEARSMRADVSIQRFPLGVPQPICAKLLSGHVAIARYLTSTGSRVYDPPILHIDGEVFAEVCAGRIVSFGGNPTSARHVEEHYARVANLFGIDGHVVHSWHAGIHPGCSYDAPANDNPDRWSNTAFSNPRLLHFHTCGDSAPGEICWMILDATVKVDSVALWEAGRLRLENFPSTLRCTTDWSDLAALTLNPSDMIGLSA